jgi:hypothetical protein
MTREFEFIFVVNNYEQYSPLGCDTVQTGLNLPLFRKKFYVFIFFYSESEGDKSPQNNLLRAE